VANKKPLALYSGVMKELQSGDTMSSTDAPGGGAIVPFTDINSASPTLAVSKSYRFRTRVTAGVLPASPGLGGGPIRIVDGTGAASTSAHTITPNGAETISIAGTAYNVLSLDNQNNVFVLIPITGGWELKVA
jgi:hypothetical protein